MHVNSEASICSPRCKHQPWHLHDSCPTDGPKGAKGQVGCNFIDEDTNEKFCALECQVDGDCGEEATCYINPDVKIGFCGYKQ